MTPLVTAPARRLAAALADLREKVRAALAGELARHVAAAVREAVEAAVAGRHAGPPPRRAWADDPDDRWGRPAHAWDDPDDEYDVAPPDRPTPPPPAGAGVAAAVAAGAAAARWWLARTGHALHATVVGLAVGAAALLGGPAARAALAGVTGLLAAAAALGPDAEPN